MKTTRYNEQKQQRTAYSTSEVWSSRQRANEDGMENTGAGRGDAAVCGHTSLKRT